ncbi:MAG: alpha/beta fold hydrolase, partial [Spirochaetota bacterium]
LLPDLPNHGESPHSSEMSYSVMTAALAETLDGWGVDRIHLMGHSMGGKVAMAFALRHPDRVADLVVVDIAPRPYPGYHRGIIDTMRKVPVETLAARSGADPYLAEGIPNRGVRAFLMKNLVRREDGGGYAWRLNLPVIQAEYDHLSSWPAPEDGASYDGPVLFIGGDASPYMKDVKVGELRRLFPMARIKTIEGSGHWVHAEARERFLATVSRHLEQHEGRAQTRDAAGSARGNSTAASPAGEGSKGNRGEGSG